MPKYLVTRLEIWKQPIEVEADTEDQARIKADESDGTICSDPQYFENHYEALWPVERIEVLEP